MMYEDKFTCPHCKITFTIFRREASSGRKVLTYCTHCFKPSKALAGPLPKALFGEKP